MEDELVKSGKSIKFKVLGAIKMSRFDLAEFEARLNDDCIDAGVLADFDSSIKAIRQEQVFDQEGEALAVGSVILPVIQVQINTVTGK